MNTDELNTGDGAGLPNPFFPAVLLRWTVVDIAPHLGRRSPPEGMVGGKPGMEAKRRNRLESSSIKHELI
ncbi:MAG: hypothetical protein KO206_04875 [Methanomicrobiaceae archaeon]|nr:hypothetical protein [Methanomicrobiaceae archaeon]MDD5418962.1 hypothetical protein [Methanomicrobiaceae archaeon]